MSLEELANPNTPGYGVRLALMKKGAIHEQQRLISYLFAKGVLRESMFGDGFVAVAEYLPESGNMLDWKAIDLPKDLADWQPKGEEN